jgi:outer membrane protein assembly factor BamB
MHQGPSYLLALDRKTGEQAWKQTRDLGAPAESRDSYTTPLVLTENGREILVVLGADHVTAHRADTGAELWRFGGLNPQGRQNFRQIASPTATDDLIIAPYGRGETFTAIRRGGDGDVSTTHRAWVSYDASVDVPSPLAYEGRVYVCGDRGDVTCLALESGQQLWQERLPRSRHVYSASPVLADGKLHLTREDGTTFVLRLGDKPELIATNALRENTYATPVFVDGRVYLRTSDYLFCIGES